MRIAELRSGDVLGELKIVDPQPSSASVIAVTEVTALAMDLDTFAESPTLTAVRPILLRNVGRILAAKLRSTTGEGADAMQRELDESRARVHAGRFIVLIFTMLATYQLAISALDLVPEFGASADLGPVIHLCDLGIHSGCAVASTQPVLARILWLDDARQRPDCPAGADLDHPPCSWWWLS